MKINKQNNIDFLESIILIGLRYEQLKENYEDKEKFCQALLSSKLDISVSVLDYTVEYLKNKKEGENLFFKKTYIQKLEYIFRNIFPAFLEEYRYDLLKKIVNLEATKLKKENFLLQNVEGLKRIIEHEYRKKENYELKEDLEDIDISKSTNLVLEYLDFVDKTGKYKNVFLEEFQKGNIYIWDIYEKEVPKKVLKNVEIDDIFSFVTIGKTPFLNAPCKGNILDAYSIVHEWIHFISEKEKKYSKDITLQETFFKELCSVFHEKYFREFLYLKGFSHKDLDVILAFRNTANKIHAPYLLSLMTLVQNENRSIDTLLILIKIKYGEQIKGKNIKEICDNLIEEFMYMYGNYLESYQYFIAAYLADIVIEKIRSGKTYLLKRMQNITSMINTSLMDPLYIINYLECQEAFYDFFPVDNVYPKRIEEKKRILKKQN